MWVRKDVFELVKDDRHRRRRARFNPEWPLVIGILVFVVVTVAALLLNEFRGGLPLWAAALVGLCIGVVIAIVAFAVRILGWGLWFRSGRSKTVLCEWCFKARGAGRDTICECGGQLESLDYWKWVEDPAPDSVRE